MHGELDTSQITHWRSIVTLVVFVLTNLLVLFPFHVPLYIPRALSNLFLDTLALLRIIPRREADPGSDSDSSPDKRDIDHHHDPHNRPRRRAFVRINFPLNFATAPIIADLFLLAILAIGRAEVRAGILGSDNINPLDIMGFFITLAYIAISIDASGLIRYLAFRVLQWGGRVGHRLFFFLYAFFFLLGSFIGNDPIILSVTPFLAYMTRVSSNIVHPRAWIHTQFAVANIASAILVSSNPTNLVLAGAFNIKFVVYTANMIVPVVVTAVVLFPCLLYIIFANPALIPYSIKMHELPEEARAKKPVNPNIPHARGNADDAQGDAANDPQSTLLSLEEIMNPFLDKGGALFGAVIMAATLVTLVVLNAVSTSNGEHPVFWVTLPAAFVMFCWDVAFGWYHRRETREISRRGRQELEYARAERAVREADEIRQLSLEKDRRADIAAADDSDLRQTSSPDSQLDDPKDMAISTAEAGIPMAPVLTGTIPTSSAPPPPPAVLLSEDGESLTLVSSPLPESSSSAFMAGPDSPRRTWPMPGVMEPLDEDPELAAADAEAEAELRRRIVHELDLRRSRRQTTLVSLVEDGYRWLQDTFPTVTAVVMHLPFPLVPFALAMFVLVQALVTKGWVPVFAYGWDHWVHKTGTVGIVAGMGFLSVVLCNFAGTNIGTAILLSRVIQAWQEIHRKDGTPISNRNFWATVYSMAIGVNYGAFSTAFSASLAGLLWRDILARKHIRVRAIEFARINLPIIAIAMAVGCTVLIGEVYIIRGSEPYES